MTDPGFCCPHCHTWWSYDHYAHNRYHPVREGMSCPMEWSLTGRCPGVVTCVPSAVNEQLSPEGDSVNPAEPGAA